MPVDHETLMRAAEHAGLDLDEGTSEALARDLAGVLRWASAMPSVDDAPEPPAAAAAPVDGT